MSENENEPGTQPGVPADPFTTAHVNRVAVVENIRGYRSAGATWPEAIGLQAALFVATFLAGGTDG